MIHSKTVGTQKEMAKHFNDYIERAEENFPNHLKNSLKKKIGKDTFLRILNKKDKGKGCGFSIETLDIICMCAYDDFNATFFRKFGITKVEDLKPYCAQKAWEEVIKLDNLGLLYIKYGSMDQDWKSEIGQISCDSKEEEKIFEEKEIQQKGSLENESIEIFTPDVNIRTESINFQFYKIRLLFFVLFLVGISAHLYTSSKNKDSCYKKQKIARKTEEKTAEIRVLILPFKKGKSEIEKTPECILYGKFQQLIVPCPPILG